LFLRAGSCVLSHGDRRAAGWSWCEQRALLGAVPYQL
jgi:hypothetical protein